MPNFHYCLVRNYIPPLPSYLVILDNIKQYLKKISKWDSSIQIKSQLCFLLYIYSNTNLDEDIWSSLCELIWHTNFYLSCSVFNKVNLFDRSTHDYIMTMYLPTSMLKLLTNEDHFNWLDVSLVLMRFSGHIIWIQRYGWRDVDVNLNCLDVEFNDHFTRGRTIKTMFRQ